jgi:hypothetical protein
MALSALRLFKEIDMAQRPTSDFDIDPNITSGTDLANILNRFQDAIDSGNSGPSRPAYLAAGGMWVKEGDPMRLYLYDGSKDIELYNTTDGLVGGSQWKDNGDDIYFDEGNVGIGTDSINAKLSVTTDDPAARTMELRGFRSNQDVLHISNVAGVSPGDAESHVRVTCNGDQFWGDLVIQSYSTFFTQDGIKSAVIDNFGNVGIGVLSPQYYPDYSILHVAGPTTTGSGLVYLTNSDSNIAGVVFADGVNQRVAFGSQTTHPVTVLTDDTERMRIDDQGRVGVGGTPSRSADEIAKEAKDTLAGWKSSFDARLKEEPKADKKAVTLEITGGEFDTLPTESKLVERLTRDNIDGGDALLQVAGDGYFTGTVYSNGSPLTRATDLIETLSTLREATRDENTLEGLRDALSDAIGGLIQKFEAQISTTES